MTLVYFILIIGIIILVHELGHFFWAKKFGVFVHEFSIGMGPKIWSKKDKKGETVYSIRAIPIGGFVSLAGEDGENEEHVSEDKVKKVPKKRLLYSKKIWQRFLIMVFGALNNFILAFLLFLIVALLSGATNLDPVISKVSPDKPAAIAGMQSGAHILEVNGKKTKTVEDIQLHLVLAKPGSEVSFRVKEKDSSKVYKVKPIEEKIDGKKSFIYGIEFHPKKERGLLKSIKFSFKKMGATLRQMAIVLSRLFTGQLSLSNLSGPFGILFIVGDVSAHGFASLLLLTAVLSVNIGFINLIPFPAFDGGRIVFLLIEKIKGSPVNPKIENAVNTVGFIFLLILTFIVMINDIIRIIK